MAESLIGLVLQGSAAAVLLLGFLAVVNGHLRTKQELEAETRRCADSQERAKRAEVQVDTLLPAVQRLTELLNRHLEGSP